MIDFAEIDDVPCPECNGRGYCVGQDRSLCGPGEVWQWECTRCRGAKAVPRCETCGGPMHWVNVGVWGCGNCEEE